MRLLVLGGTLFLGRHVAEAALERGHELTLFTRGRTNPDLYPEAEHLVGDRDGDLSALEGREWDAVVDPSAYVPRVASASADLLSGSVGHYTFISSISAYRDFERTGIDEDYPVGELPADHGEDVNAYYGQLKAACERAVTESFEGPVNVVRAGLIVGPYDWTNRFGWWIRRVAAGGEVLIPDAQPWDQQVIDGRDLARWVLDQAECGAGGTFNTTGPEDPLEMREVLETARAVSGSDATFVLVSEGFLLEQGVEPYEELPLWVAVSANPAYAGFDAVDVSRAVASGLRYRALRETVADTLAWERERAGAPDKDWGPSALASGLDPDRERELIAAWREREPSR